MSVFVGIDVSKKTLDVAWFSGHRRVHLKVSNSLDGFTALVQQCPSEVHFVMEATGAYYLRLAYYLHDNKLKVSVVNPLTIKRFGQMKLRRAKTDKADAFLISSYGQTQSPALWHAPSLKILEMQQLWTLSDTLQKQKGALSNQLEAFSEGVVLSKVAATTIEKNLVLINKQLGLISRELETIALTLYPREMEILESIPGIGKKSSIALLIVSKGFKEFQNGRSLCSFIGLTPRISQSGTSLNVSGSITKIGQCKMRALLYMCALTACKKNSGCKNMYERLTEKGKAKKLALVAVAAKLVRQAVALIKKDELFCQDKAVFHCF
ncbi:MAG: IS110 family transposase [bacterium]|nr:IS110 family transposase [bacterium]